MDVHSITLPEENVSREIGPISSISDVIRRPGLQKGMLAAAFLSALGILGYAVHSHGSFSHQQAAEQVHEYQAGQNRESYQRGENELPLIFSSYLGRK